MVRPAPGPVRPPRAARPAPSPPAPPAPPVPSGVPGGGRAARIGWSPGAAFLLAAAAAALALVYAPERARSAALRAEMAPAAGDPAAVDEALRRELRHGRPGEYAVTDLYYPRVPADGR